jgi:hypothetical protein
MKIVQCLLNITWYVIKRKERPWPGNGLKRCMKKKKN